MSGRRTTWQEVRDRVHAAILSGRYRPGDRLPRDADIADEFNCARSTVQRAMRDLAESGLVDRRRKGGTRMRPDPVARAMLEIPIIRREVEDRGGVHGYRLIGVSEEVPPPCAQAAMALPGPEPMLRIRALHLSDARPYLYEDRWVCTKTVPEILTVDLSRESANEWLVKNVPYSRFDLRFYAEKAEGRSAGLLGAETGEALFAIERTTWTGDAPVTHVKALAGPGYVLSLAG